MLKIILNWNLSCRNISGVYTTDFPDHPLSYFNFTGDNIPDDIALTKQGTKVKVLNYNEAVEIVFQGTNLVGGAANHPIHLHGYSFFVVGTGSGNFDNKTDPKGFNLVDPPEVNTFGVPRNGWLAIRFLANNPGIYICSVHV
jgi:laccase